MTERLTGEPLVVPETELSVATVGETADYLRLRCAGEIDQSTAGLFADALAAAVPGRRRVEVDLGAVTFMDSSGINALVQHRDPGCELVLVEVPPRIRRVLEITALDRIFCP
ncbi:STAS domain-containing protein [Actinoplanes sp. NPDC049681]|uniref:STAS domain-containing protein n=1 Tax=Actinoplanes sp. NPDC049681 TaxID=3363905 RepID=UPI0037A4688F